MNYIQCLRKQQLMYKYCHLQRPPGHFIKADSTLELSGHIRSTAQVAWEISPADCHYMSNHLAEEESSWVQFVSVQLLPSVTLSSESLCHHCSENTWATGEPVMHIVVIQPLTLRVSWRDGLLNSDSNEKGWSNLFSSLIGCFSLPIKDSSFRNYTLN